jgi:hypothetical protein
MDQIQLFITTFNCGKTVPLSSQFTKSIENSLPDNISDLYVFGFQEISSILDCTDSNLVNKHFINVANNLIECLRNKFQFELFEIISINHIGSTGIILITPFLSNINKIYLSNGHPVGFFYTNLKGGIGIRLCYKEIEITFVCMHLNAGEKIQNLIRRNKDLNNILKNLLFNDGWCVFKPNTHCFILGDLNYRSTGAFNFLRSINSDIEEEDIDLINDNENNNNINLLKFDELIILKKHLIIFENFNEAEIKFPPTYKYIVGTNSLNLKRKPSYCDRILFLDYYNINKKFEYNILDYNIMSDCLISDHLPVYLLINISNIPPESIISNEGYLTDRSTKLIETSQRFKNHFYNKYVLQISSCTTYLLGLLLFLTTTIKGRFIILSILILAYGIWRWY